MKKISGDFSIHLLRGGKRKGTYINQAKKIKKSLFLNGESSKPQSSQRFLYHQRATKARKSIHRHRNSKQFLKTPKLKGKKKLKP